MKKFTLLMAALLLITSSLNAANSKTEVAQVSSSVSLTTDVDYVITGETPFATAGSVDIQNTEHAVLIIQKIKPSKVIANWMGNIFIKGEKAVNGKNCQVKMYNRGAIVFPYGSDFKPLTCYTEENYGGTSCNNYTEGHSGGYMKTMTSALLNNQVKSFKLKRGYMVTFAIGTSGWGYSRCFIADQEDLEVSTLPAILSGRISSYRLFKWFNAHKAGLASNGDYAANQALNSSWCYDWAQGNSNNLPDTEWVPNHIYEDWPSTSTCGSVDGSCHMKANNEPGNSADDRPQDVETVLNNWQNMMRTGMRLCSESSHDGSMNHLKEFIDSIDARGWRCDILDLHCYWASGTFNSLTWYSDHYGNGRPIWISEWVWGASWNNNGIFGAVSDRDDFSKATQQINYNGTKPILDLLNSNKRVERYAYWNGEANCSKIYKDGKLSTLGEYYATMNDGMGYDPSLQFIPKETRMENLGELTYTYTKTKGTVVLNWKDPNGDLMDKIIVQCKLPGTISYKDIAEVDVKDKNGNTVSYAYTDEVSEPGAYTYRIKAVSYKNKTFLTNDVTVDVAPAQGTGSFQFGKLTISSSDPMSTSFSESQSVAPNVFMGTMTNYNSAFYASNFTCKTRNQNSFSFQFQPWSTNKGAIAKNEDLPFMAIPSGNYDFDGLQCEVNEVKSERTLSGTSNIYSEESEVVFTQPFAEGVVPVVLTEIRNPILSTTAFCVRVYDVTNKGFKFRVYTEEATGKTVSLQMNVAYFAIAPGVGTIDSENSIYVAAGHGSQEQIYGSSLRENLFTVDSENGPQQLYMQKPAVFTALQTNNYPTVVMLRRTDTTEKDEEGQTWTTGVKVKRILDHDIVVDGSTISRNSTSASTEAYRDNMGWVCVSGTILQGEDKTPVGISSISRDNASELMPTVENGRIHVAGVKKYDVYSISGAKMNPNGVLTPGIYVVRANGKSMKVLVK